MPQPPQFDRFGQSRRFHARCLEQPKAAGETFLIADGHDVSTAELVQGLAAGMEKEMPHVSGAERSVRHLLLRSAGKEALWNRLWGDLQIDPSKARELLDWTHRARDEAGLSKSVRGTVSGAFGGAWA